jgi:Concanavalin A-like lectin/glucanases superfamily
VSNVQKTRARNIAAFVDNTAGLISAQDGRNLVLSAFDYVFAANPDNTADLTNTGGWPNAEGFDVATRWFNSITQRVWESIDSTIGAAVWKEIAWLSDIPGGIVVAPGEGIRVDLAGSTFTVTDLVGQGRATRAQRFIGDPTCYLSNLATTRLPDPAGTPFTISMMLRTTNPGQTCVFACQSDSLGMTWEFELVSDILRFFVTTAGGGGGPVSVPSPLADGEWHHVLGSYRPSDNTYAIVVDGSVIDSGTVGWTTHLSSGLTIGAEYFDGVYDLPFDGDIAEFMILFAFYTDVNYQALYNDGCGYLYRQLPCDIAGPPLIQYYPLEQDSGLPAVDLVAGLQLFQGPIPTTAVDGVCGMRLGCVGLTYIPEDGLVTFLPGLILPAPQVGCGDLPDCVTLDPGSLRPGRLPDTVVLPRYSLDPPLDVFVLVWDVDLTTLDNTKQTLVELDSTIQIISGYAYVYEEATYTGTVPGTGIDVQIYYHWPIPNTDHLQFGITVIDSGGTPVATPDALDPSLVATNLLFPRNGAFPGAAPWEILYTTPDSLATVTITGGILRLQAVCARFSA